MGSGKSTIGPLLAAALGEKFVDLDDVIVRGAGMNVAEVFAKEGEAGWRRRERASLAALGTGGRTVLSCGGGVILSSENRALLHDQYLAVYLRTSPDTLVERLRDDTGRPLLDADDPEAALRRIYDERTSLYEEAADISVITDQKPPELLVREILTRIEDGFDDE